MPRGRPHICPYCGIASSIRKGVRKTNSKLISETKEKVVYQVELWKRFKSDLKLGNLNQQIIEVATKEVFKTYDKGKTIDNIVYPYSIIELQAKI